MEEASYWKDIVPILQTLSYIFAIFVFIWQLRKDSREDYNKLDSRLKEEYNKLDSKLECWRRESNALILSIHEEMKDFHGRLCAIEAAKKGEVK
jgi:hypothetical protein